MKSFLLKHVSETPREKRQNEKCKNWFNKYCRRLVKNAANKENTKKNSIQNKTDKTPKRRRSEKQQQQQNP